MKKCLSMMLAAIMLLCLIPTTTVFAAKEMFLSISSVKVSGVTTPVVGEKPSLNAVSEETGKYTVAKVFWAEYDKDFEWVKDMGTGDAFREGYYYFVFINLETKSAYTFGNSMTQTINGKSANKYTPSDGGTKVQIYTHFESEKRIDKVELNVVKPVVGKTPTFAKIDTAQYVSEKYGTVSNCSNGVTWTNQSSGINITVSNPFKDGVKYKVSYYLTAKSGYMFDSNTKCTINGSSATLKITDKNHAIVSLSDLVAGDGKREISSLDLSVTAPKEGEKPTYNKIDGTGYYSDNGLNGTSTRIYKNGIAWYKSSTSYISPGTTETFKSSTEYTLKISLTAKSGYKFSKSLTAKINGKSATVEAFEDGSINVSVKLTALGKDHKHTNSDWKTDKENHWKVCTDKACGTITVEKEAHKDSNMDNKCDVCKFVLSAETTSEPTESVQKPTEEITEPTEESTETIGALTEKEEKDNDGQNKKINPIIWVILGVVVILLGVGAAIVILVVKKKK